MRLAGRVALVTGGSRGIGRAISLAFSQEGAKVVVVDINKERCDELAAQITRAGGEAICIKTDVSSEAEVAGMMRQVKEAFQRIDILVNNAAVNIPYKTVADLTLKEWNWIIGVNMTGVFLCSRAAFSEMMAQRSGKIINMASWGGRYGAAGRVPYRPTKAAIINFTECLAAEGAEYGIEANAICPGAVDTDMMHEITGGNVPDKMITPEEIAAVAVFLASDESRSITGTAIDAFGRNNPLFGFNSSVRPPK